MARRISEGKTTKEALRALKRFIARQMSTEYAFPGVPHLTTQAAAPATG
jgi:hypothetical protein